MEPPKVYFGAADRQMEPFLDESSFQDSLVYALLFQGDIVISDIFFYVSNHISNFINGPYKDFFLSAIQCGAIIPSFRNNTNQSFIDNYNDILKDGIQSILPDSQTTVKVFQDTIDRTTRFKPHYWGEKSVGAGFAKTVQEILLTDNHLSMNSNQDFNKIWTNSYDLRQKSINIAMEECTKREWGLRRGEVYNAVLKILDLKDPQQKGTELILLAKHKSPEIKNLEYFLKWINYCYHINQGRSFGLYPALPKMDEVDLILSNKFCPIQNSSDSSNFLGSFDIFSSEFRIPSTIGIFKIPHEKLWGIRNGEEGALYFNALNKWQSQPNEESANYLLEKIKVYAEALTECFIEERLNLYNYIRPLIPSSSKNIATISDMIYKTASGFLDILGNISLVSELTTCVYKILPHSTKDFINKKLDITKPIKIELTDRTHQIKNLTNFTTESRYNIT